MGKLGFQTKLALSVALGLSLGFLAGTSHHEGPRFEPWIRVYGCGLRTTVALSADEVFQVREVIARLQPLPASATHAFIRTAEGSYSGTIREAASTNGTGRVPLFGGETIQLVHAGEVP